MWKTVLVINSKLVITRNIVGIKNMDW